MVEPSGLLSGFKITTSYKYILYIAGVILILSLFIDAPNIDNKIIKDTAIYVIGAGLLLWFIHQLVNIIIRVWADYNEYVNTILLGFLIIQVATWITVFLFIIRPHM